MADTFNPDAYLAQASSQTGNASSDTDISNFDPDDYLLQSKYGTPSQQAIAGVEGATRGASLGLSDVAETQLGISTPQAISGRMQANPWTSLAGNVVGGAALMGATGGFGGLAEGVAGNAAAGAIFGAGNAVSDVALGDPDVNAQKLLADVGMGAALGGGLGILSKAIGAVPAFLRSAPQAEAEAAIGGTGSAPESLAEMQAAIDNAKKYGNQANIAELPQKPVAEAAAADLAPDLGDFGINQMQLNALDSAKDLVDFKNTVELPGKQGDLIRTFQNEQKRQLVSILDNQIDNISPGYKPTSNATEAGERAAQAFTDTIQRTRDELGPAFEQIKSTPLADIDHLPGVVDYLTDKAKSPYGNPAIASMFDTTGDKIAIKPYNSQMGIADTTYTNIKKLVNDLSSIKPDLEGLTNARSNLLDKVDPYSEKPAAIQLTQAKAALMDYIQDQVQNIDPNLAVRDTFKRWAINEQNAQLIEKKFTAEIGSDNWRSKATGGDEGILKKIFRDSDSVAQAKAILPPQDFNNMLADHLAILRNDATTDNAFSSSKFATSLKRNQYPLGEAFSDHGNAYGKINSATTLMRLFPDSISANPPHTARTMMEVIARSGLSPSKYLDNLYEFGKGKILDVAQTRDINAKLAGQSDAAKKLTSIKGIISRVNDQMGSTIKGIFSSSEAKGGFLSAATSMSNDKFDKISEDLRSYSSNPQQFIEDTAANTETLHNAAPSITQSIVTSMATAVSFLTQKLPQPVSQMPLSPPFEPTNAQKTIFNQYYQAVNNPLNTLKQVKNGSITNQAMEALQAVHPALLNEMRQKIMESMNLEKTRDIPYAKKLSLAKFLGSPLDNNMTPQAIMSNQVSFNMPRQSQQNAPQSGRKNPLGGLKQLKLSDRTQLAGHGNEEE